MATTRPAKAAWSLLALFLDEVVVAGAAADESSTPEADVTLADPEESVPFVPSFSWKTPPGTAEGLANVELAWRDVAEAEVVEATLVVDTAVVLSVLDDELVVDEVVLELEVVVEELEVVATACSPTTMTAASDEVGVAFFVEEGAGAGEALWLDEVPPVDPSVLKKTTLADPDVTVTTQKSAPPAPVADS